MSAQCLLAVLDVNSGLSPGPSPVREGRTLNLEPRTLNLSAAEVINGVRRMFNVYVLLSGVEKW